MGRISGLVPSRFLTLLAHLVVVITLFWSRVRRGQGARARALLALPFSSWSGPSSAQSTHTGSVRCSVPRPLPNLSPQPHSSFDISFFLPGSPGKQHPGLPASQIHPGGIRKAGQPVSSWGGVRVQGSSTESRNLGPSPFLSAGW